MSCALYENGARWASSPSTALSGSTAINTSLLAVLKRL